MRKHEATRDVEASETSSSVVRRLDVVHFAYSMACIPMYAVMMDNSRLGSAGFDYTLQVSIVFVGSLIAGALSGFIATTIGYRGTFALSAAISLIGVAVIAKTFEDFANSV